MNEPPENEYAPIPGAVPTSGSDSESKKTSPLDAAAPASDALDAKLTSELIDDALLANDGLDEVEEEEEFTRPAWMREMPFWALSGLLHLLLLFLVFGIILDRRTQEDEATPLVLRRAPPPVPYDPTKKRDIIKKMKIPQPKIPQIPVVRKKIEEVTLDIPKGTDLLRQSDFNLQSRFFNEAIGLGGGAAGAYGARWGKGSLKREGGGEETESAVRAALEWLVRHQSPDGGWRSATFTRRCKKTCRNKNKGNSVGAANYDVGVTALAVLAFTGAGNTHRASTNPRFTAAMRRALEYLLSKQVKKGADSVRGRIGSGNHHKVMYEHSIATMALGEMLILSGDKIKLSRPVRAAVEYCLRARNPGKAWRYGYRDGDNDTSVAGWFILAIKTGKLAQLGIPTTRYTAAFQDAIKYFRSLTDDQGRTGYASRGAERGSVPTMTSVAALCRLFGGERRSSNDLRSAMTNLLAHRPAWKDNGKGVDFYYWYYATYAAFQVGGKSWKSWNPPMKKALISSQRRGACEDGSWDPIGPWGKRAGRVYATALGAMTLEVYYRFERTRAGVGFLGQ